MTSAPTARSAGRDPGERGDAEFPGVLAVLAVDELRTASGDRVHERLYLEGLAQDFDRTANDIVGVTNTYEATLAYGDLVLPVLRRETDVPHDTVAFLVAVYETTRCCPATDPCDGLRGPDAQNTSTRPLRASFSTLLER